MSDDDKRKRGLWRNEAGNPGKFEVRRTDGRDAPGEKHDGCSYFVLDLTHDPHARVAARAYADSAERDGYGPLSYELRSLVREAELDAAGEALMRQEPKR